MECSLLSCSNLALQDLSCTTCYLPKYCSRSCQASDLPFHSISCRPHLFTLKDFAPAKTLQKILGTGAYGEVQLVQKNNSKSLFALKIYKKAQLISQIPLKVLFREISLHRTLVHTNIVRLIDSMEDHLKIYLLLEYVDKGSVFDLLRTKVKLSEREAFKIFSQTCTGLNYLHNKNLLHRDLKPENLLLTKTDVVKICDFGWTAPESEKRFTFCGTLDYMSPEMLKNFPQTCKVDVWAMGILLYEMLHGTGPFIAKNPNQMLKLISERGYRIGPHISKSARELIKSLLNEHPEARPSIIEILKSTWVQEHHDAALKPESKVSHNVKGLGVVKEVVGLVCKIEFSTSTEEMIESDVLTECSVVEVDSMYDNSISIRTAPDLDSDKSPTPKHSGASSPNSPIIKSSIKSARNSRVNSKNSSPTRNAHVTFAPALRDKKLPKSPRALEEVKAPEPIRKLIIHDYEGIELSPEVAPVFMVKRGGTPKSRFLMNYKPK